MTEKNEWLSIKDFAKIANVSKQSVYKRLSTSLNPYLKVENGVKYLNIKALNDIYGKEVIQPIQPDSQPFQPYFQPDSQPDSQPFQPQNDKIQNKIISENNDNNFIEFLLKQIDIKDRQIAELQQALNQEQQLHLLSKQRVNQLEAVNDVVEEKSKKGFWDRIFRK